MGIKYIIGIDCGTQSTRCMVFDQSGNIITSSKRKTTVETNKEGFAEQEVISWWDTTCETLREVTAQIDPRSICGLSISYMRESIALIDEKGKGLCPAIIWYDQRGDREIEDLKKTVGGARFLQLTGKIPNKLPPVIKLAWMKNNRKEILEKAWKVVDVISYLHWHLTGNLTGVVAGADTTGMLNVSKRTWDEELVQFAGVRMDQLAELAESGTVIGHVTQEASAETGLPEGCPVIAGGGDGQVFAIGAGAALKDRFVLNLGTAITGGVQSEKFVTDRHFRTNISCIKGHYMYEYLILSGCKLVTWFVENFAKEELCLVGKSGKSVETMLEEQIVDIPCGSEGLMTIPYWDGCIMPYNDNDARGITVGWSAEHTKAHFYRSILEGFAYQLKDFTEALVQNVGNIPDIINIGGGGGNSMEWCRIISAATHMAIQTSKSVESSMMGCFIIAATSLGWFSDMESASKAVLSVDRIIKPAEEDMEVYDALYNDKYKKLYLIFRNVLL